jgi:hypothetical protein
MVLVVKDIDWEKLKQQIQSKVSFINEYGDECKEMSLGKVADLTPSGKRRDFGRPSRNLEATGSYKGCVRATELGTRPPNKDEQQDSDWSRDLVDGGKEHGIYIRPSSDKNRTFIMAGIKIKDRSET